MSKTAELLIIINKGRHKTQPYTITINEPGNAPEDTKRERYATWKTAARGGLRKVGCWCGRIRGPHTVVRKVRGKERVYPVKIVRA